MKPLPRHVRDTFQSETYVSPIARATLTHWDYRDAEGVLHSGVAHGPRETAEADASRFGYVTTAESAVCVCDLGHCTEVTCELYGDPCPHKEG